MNTLTDYIIVAASLIVFMLAFIAAIIGLSYWYESTQCEAYSEVTKRDTKFRAGMCYIKDGDDWYAWSEYKLRNAATGLKP